MSNSEITNFYMEVIRLFTIVPANEIIYVTMVPRRTVGPVTVINVSFII